MQSVNNINEAAISEELVSRILVGDKEAEQEMVIRYHRGLIAMLYNRSHDRPLAEDVAQETWLLVINKVRNQELKDKKRLAGFITQIAKNQLLMKYRTRNRHHHVTEDEAQELPDAGPTPDQSLENNQLAGVIQGMLNEMRKPRDRELIRRFYLLGDSKSVLCKEFELTEAHFDRVLFRARERFKKLWSQQAL